MSILYDRYKKLKNDDDKKCYLFENGVFYTMIDEDAKMLAPILSLKLVHLNEEILKCGFPRNSLDKYKDIFDENKIKFEVVPKKEKMSNDDIVKIIKKIDINNITPVEALNKLKELKDKV